MDYALQPLRDWDAEQHQWLVKAIEKAEKDAKPPEDRRVRVDDATIEAVRDALDARHGASVIDTDELAGYLNGLGQYKRGKGSDGDRVLSLWKGSPWLVKRAGGTDILINRPTLPICGGLQLERHGRLGPDGDGSRVRWLPFATPELAGDAMTDAQPPAEWAATMRRLLTRRASERRWKLEPAAAGLFHEHRKQFKARTRGGERTTVSLALAKADVALGRYALVLAELADPGAEARGLTISVDVIAAAARIVEFNLDCWRALPEQDMMEFTFADRVLNPGVAKLIAWLERNGGQATFRELLLAKVAGCRKSSDLLALLSLYEESYPGSVERDVIPPGGGRGATIVRAAARGA